MADSKVVLLNGAKSSNIFWQVAGVVTILADLVHHLVRDGDHV